MADRRPPISSPRLRPPSSPHSALSDAQPAFSKAEIHYMSRGEKYRHGLAKDKRLIQIIEEHGWTYADHMIAEWLLGAFLCLHPDRSDS